MSPDIPPRGHAERGFPRVSGDEPLSLIEEEAIGTFSPRERG